MKKKIVAGVTLSVVLIILLAVILVFGGSVFSNCSILENQVHDFLEKANYCSTDSDCVLADSFGCPFGCYNLINKNADTDKIKESVQNYHKCTGNAGYECLYDCMPSPAQEQIKCTSNKCIDSRFENK